MTICHLYSVYSQICTLAFTIVSTHCKDLEYLSHGRNGSYVDLHSKREKKEKTVVWAWPSRGPDVLTSKTS